MKIKSANNEECDNNHDVRLMYMMRLISNEPMQMLPIRTHQ